MHKLSRVKIILAGASMLSVGAFATIAYANHAWGNYHWGRTSSPFTLQLGNNVSSAWITHLAAASTDWSVSTVLDTTVVTGLSNPSCKATKGRVEVCSRAYGSNGWLGVAQIWTNGNHIVQGTVKLNDTYFSTATYNTPAWKQFVACQEIGHTLGLDHQDVIFDNPNIGTCMDYTNDPLTNQHPNQHDYDQLAIIYTHLDSTNTFSQSTVGGNGKPANVGQNIDPNDPSAWGKAVRQDARGNNSLYERDLGNGEKLFTFVIWAN